MFVDSRGSTKGDVYEGRLAMSRAVLSGWCLRVI